MKVKCDQCGTVFEGSSYCPVCGAEPETVRPDDTPLSNMDRDSFWQEVKYAGEKLESDR